MSLDSKCSKTKPAENLAEVTTNDLNHVMRPRGMILSVWAHAPRVWLLDAPMGAFLALSYMCDPRAGLTMRPLGTLVGMQPWASLQACSCYASYSLWARC